MTLRWLLPTLPEKMELKVLAAGAVVADVSGGSTLLGKLRMFTRQRQALTILLCRLRLHVLPGWSAPTPSLG